MGKIENKLEFFSLFVANFSSTLCVSPCLSLSLCVSLSVLVFVCLLVCPCLCVSFVFVLSPCLSLSLCVSLSVLVFVCLLSLCCLLVFVSPCLCVVSLSLCFFLVTHFSTTLSVYVIVFYNSLCVSLSLCLLVSVLSTVRELFVCLLFTHFCNSF